MNREAGAEEEVKRRKFERWAAGQQGLDIKRGVHYPDGYFYAETHRAWDAWQTAWRAGRRAK